MTCVGADKRFTLVIDAGHGGHDAGALGAFSKEKDINLSVALAFGRDVEQNCPDVKVIYTRKTDVFVPLDDRANIANKNKADLFMSIHTNALPSGHIARGLETYTLGMARVSANLDVAKRENSVILVEKDYKQRYEGFNPNSSESYIMFEFMQDKYMEKSVDLAKRVQNHACSAAHRPDKGVHQAGFLVLRCTSMPSCLIELGFITTPDEEQYLNSDSGVEALGRGIYEAFVEYRNKYDKSVTIPFVASESKIPLIVDGVDEQTVTDEKPKMTKRGRRIASQRIISTEVKNESQQADSSSEDSELIFKLQIVASSRSLRPGSQQLKGEMNAECFQEDDLFKYTIGASANYNEIYRLRKSVLSKYPQAFVIAFKNGKKMNINEAIREFKLNKK
jgi:N-acetylmuramoyl-L-alanine amidase